MQMCTETALSFEHLWASSSISASFVSLSSGCVHPHRFPMPSFSRANRKSTSEVTLQKKKGVAASVALAGEVAVAKLDGWRWWWWWILMGIVVGGGGEAASADAHRRTALPESCRSLRQLSPSPPPTLPPLPLPSVKHTQNHGTR